MALVKLLLDLYSFIKITLIIVNYIINIKINVTIICYIINK